MLEQRSPFCAATDAWCVLWEDAGVTAVEQDLIRNDGRRYCSGSGHVRRLAWRWLRLKRVAALQEKAAGINA